MSNNDKMISKMYFRFDWTDFACVLGKEQFIGIGSENELASNSFYTRFESSVC